MNEGYYLVVTTVLIEQVLTGYNWELYARPNMICVATGYAMSLQQAREQGELAAQEHAASQDSPENAQPTD